MLRGCIGKYNWLKCDSAKVRYEFLVIYGKTHRSGLITKQEAFSVWIADYYFFITYIYSITQTQFTTLKSQLLKNSLHAIYRIFIERTYMQSTVYLLKENYYLLFNNIYKRTTKKGEKRKKEKSKTIPN